MRRPRWLAALVLALAIAAIFAALGQWQVGRAVSDGTADERPTETIVPLETVAEPQQPVLGVEAAQKVRASGRFESKDYGILAGRLNGGKPGYWVIGHLSVDEPGNPALAVALGWAPDRQSAIRQRDRLAQTQADASSPAVTLEGRYVDPDAPDVDDAQRAREPNADLTTMSPAALINIWTALGPDTDVYGGYLVADEAPAGLDRIDSPEPDRSVELNLLNVFYAVEWVIFAGFAIFLWFRLVKDAWEREREELAEAALAAEPSAEPSSYDHAIH